MTQQSGFACRDHAVYSILIPHASSSTRQALLLLCMLRHCSRRADHFIVTWHCMQILCSTQHVETYCQQQHQISSALALRVEALRAVSVYSWRQSGSLLCCSDLGALLATWRMICETLLEQPCQLSLDQQFWSEAVAEACLQWSMTSAQETKYVATYEHWEHLVCWQHAI